MNRGLFIHVLCGLVLLTGCAKTAAPTKSLQDLKTQAEQRLYQDGREAMYVGDYDQAIVIWERLLEHYPGSFMRDEARWWLARAYQQSGKVRLALQQYRVLAEATTPGPYQKEAELRIAELGREGGAALFEVPKVKGLLVSMTSHTAANSQSVDRIFETASKDPFTTMVINVPCKKIDLSEIPIMVREQGSGATDYLKGLVKTWVSRAHQYEKTVYLLVNLRCLGLFDTEAGWVDWAYNAESGSTQPSSWYDLFHAGYQSFVKAWLSEMAQEKIDGLIFQADAPLGAGDGLGPAAIAAFEREFGIKLTTQDLFRFQNGGEIQRFQKGAYYPELDGQNYSPLFWRWIGWKARERLRVMAGIREHLRQAFPPLQVGLALHVESVNDPVLALVRYSEDWLESTRVAFDFFLLRSDRMYDASGSILQAGAIDTHLGMKDLFEEMIRTLGASHKLWVLLPETSSSPQNSEEQACCPGQSGTGGDDLPKGIGRIYYDTPFLDKP